MFRTLFNFLAQNLMVFVTCTYSCLNGIAFPNSKFYLLVQCNSREAGDACNHQAKAAVQFIDHDPMGTLIFTFFGEKYCF